jgi:hypothetical protein
VFGVRLLLCCDAHATRRISQNNSDVMRERALRNDQLLMCGLVMGVRRVTFNVYHEAESSQVRWSVQID